MQIDESTLDQLDILPLRSMHGAEGKSILGLLDCTQLPEGRRFLLQLLREPPSTLNCALMRQESFKCVLANYELWCQWRERIPAFRVKTVVDYLSSSFAAYSPDRAGWFHGLSLSRSSREYKSFLRHGVTECARMLQAVGELLLTTKPDQVPPVATQDVTAARDLTESNEIRKVIRRSAGRIQLWTLAALVRCDGVLRVRHREAILSVVQLCGLVDCYLAVVAETNKNGFVFPQFTHGADGVLTIRGVRHPLVEASVPNDLRIGIDAPLMVLTGPNMAGKSTYMKAIGVTVYLAHLGLPVPADSMRTPFFDRIATSLSTHESIAQGYSYFRAEVDRVAAIAKWLAAGQHCLVLLDEPFKGTNIPDSVDGNRLLMRLLSRNAYARTILATHLAQLAKELKEDDLPGATFRHIEAELDRDSIVYPHQVRDGISDQRVGLRLIREAGIETYLSRPAGLPGKT